MLSSFWYKGNRGAFGLGMDLTGGSGGDKGLQLQERYEQEVTTGEGDRYQAFYTGLNYLIYGDRLKLMAGAEYSNMEDAANDGGEFRGWTYLAGLRLFF